VIVIEWQLDFLLPVQSVAITIIVVSSNPTHGRVYSIQHYGDCIEGIIVGVFVSSVVDRGFELFSDQSKDYEICICCFSATHATLSLLHYMFISI
jgi:hypothetical protein